MMNTADLLRVVADGGHQPPTKRCQWAPKTWRLTVTAAVVTKATSDPSTPWLKGQNDSATYTTWRLTVVVNHR
ncbi:unnamed protein product [Macrosiphum euphorbiae]|uniref:Uncharacterized protein n=1 Tax=Macrosiphum euphorbiae TaxID=13131 RepID=A0AAV0X1S3_9HEMI|nr:unnamed protein product [Macrosiphum euphorbiae]